MVTEKSVATVSGLEDGMDEAVACVCGALASIASTHAISAAMAAR